LKREEYSNGRDSEETDAVIGTLVVINSASVFFVQNAFCFWKNSPVISTRFFEKNAYEEKKRML
jgi:uncharacterized membrane protein YbaN (DUF454 family)